MIANYYVRGNDELTLYSISVLLSNSFAATLGKNFYNRLLFHVDAFELESPNLRPNTKLLEQSANKFIMIVDDESDILELFSDYLHMKGLKIKTFFDPIAALNEMQVNHDSYSLIVTDIRMPKMSGIEFIEKVRMIDNRIKVIFMTAFDIEKNRVGEASHEFLKKPITLENLLSSVNRVLALD